MYIFFHTDFLKLLWPNRYSYLPKMGCAQQIHESSGLSDASSNAERNPVIDDGLVVWEVKKIFLARHLELNPESVFSYPDAHRCQLVASLRHRVPHQNISVQPMILLTVLDDSLGNPIVIVSGAHLMRVTIL